MSRTGWWVGVGVGSLVLSGCMGGVRSGGAVAVEGLVGHTFHGPPVELVGEPPFEGAGEPGEIHFHDEKSVALVRPGSDIIEGGTWHLSAAGHVVLQTARGADLTLEVLEGGAVLRDVAGDTRYTRSP